MKPSQYGEVTLSFTDVGKSCKFLMFNAICIHEILAKNSQFTVCLHVKGEKILSLGFSTKYDINQSAQLRRVCGVAIIIIIIIIMIIIIHSMQQAKLLYFQGSDYQRR